MILNSFKDPTVFVQNCLINGDFEINYKFIKFEKIEEISHLECDFPIVFCSVNNAVRIKNSNLFLKKGLLFPEYFLNYSYYSQYIKDYLLNSNYLILPYGEIKNWLNKLINIFGESLFIRPNSSKKIFTGFSKTGYNEIEFELNCLQKTECICPHELCIISSKKYFSEIEWRFWLIDEEIATFAPYSWNKNFIKDEQPSDEMIKMAKDISSKLSIHDNALVADFAITSSGPKLIELNAVSTSGFYKKIDFKILIEKISNLFIMDGVIK